MREIKDCKHEKLFVTYLGIPCCSNCLRLLPHDKNIWPDKEVYSISEAIWKKSNSEKD